MAYGGGLTILDEYFEKFPTGSGLTVRMTQKGFTNDLGRGIVAACSPSADPALLRYHFSVHRWSNSALLSLGRDITTSCLSHSADPSRILATVLGVNRRCSFAMLGSAWIFSKPTMPWMPLRDSSLSSWSFARFRYYSGYQPLIQLCVLRSAWIAQSH